METIFINHLKKKEMAKFIQGANGTFSGKVGSVIGSSWRGIHYLRGLGKKSKVPATQAQIAQRQRFALLTRFLAPLQQMLNVGFRNVNYAFAGQFSMAVKNNIDAGVSGTMDNFTLNYPNLIFSMGTLYAPLSNQLTIEENLITIGWNPGLNQFSGSGNDVAYIVVYNEDRRLFITTETPAIRSQGTAEVEVPAEFTGQQGHAWMFFASPISRKVSNTLYLGDLNFL